MMLLILWVVVLLATLWLYSRQIYSTFKKQGIKHRKPIPFIGNMGKVLLQIEHVSDSINDLYHAFPEERFLGRYEILNESIVLRDIELMKKIAVKDFEYFIDHRSFSTASDSLFSRTLFSLKGLEWKDMRSTLSPAFTSSKIRLMVPFMVEVGDQMVSSLKQKIKDSNVGSIELECKDLTTRYANDVIASCAFGLKTDSYTDDNQFYTMGKLITNFKLKQMLMFLLTTNIPILGKLLDWEFMSKVSKDFYRHLVINTMKERAQCSIVRPDMIQLLMEAKKGQLTHDEVKNNDTAAGFATVDESSVGTKEVNRIWSDDDLVAQAVLFLLAGFETVSSAMTFLLYELALNPDVQEKLAQEIKEQNEKCNGKFDLNTIQKMVYMDMVVSESLRKWPPVIALDRICVKDYNMGKPNDNAEKDVIIRKGKSIAFPAFAIHRDPAFFPNPEKFDPERFSEENKHNIQTFTYMPFGLGPRNCIGSRFALCEVKVMIYQILLHFVVSPCKRTCIPAKLSPDTLNLKLKGDHWLKFQVRS